jgi:hypothetical protein
LSWLFFGPGTILTKNNFYFLVCRSFLKIKSKLALKKTPAISTDILLIKKKRRLFKKNNIENHLILFKGN